MGNKKRGNIPPIVKDYSGYHIVHSLDEKTKKHNGKLSIYAGRTKKQDGFANIKEALKYIDDLISRM